MMNGFLENIKSLQLNNKTIIVGVSTGVDSMVLLDLFMKVKDELNLKIVISHINHKKRKESDDEEAFLKEFASNNDLILEVKHLDNLSISDNFQSEARAFRYEFYTSLCEKYGTDVISLAHHGCDQIETILMRILRGSSLKGYSGMSVVSLYKKYTLFRPLLTCTKDEIYSYAHQNDIPYFEDASNQSSDYTRNRLRHGAVSALLEETSIAHTKFLEFSEVIKKASIFIDNKRDEFIKENVCFFSDGLSFSASKINSIDPFLKDEVLFELLKKHSLSKSQIDEVSKILTSSKANIISNIKNTFSIVKEYDKITILDHILEKKDVNILIDKVGTYEVMDTLNIIVSKNESISLTKKENICYNNECIYLSSVSFPLTLRSRRDGDKISLSRGAKKVKDVLIDEKIGAIQRQNILVLTDKDDDVLWICGVKKSEKIKNKDCFDIKITLKGNNK